MGQAFVVSHYLMPFFCMNYFIGPSPKRAVHVRSPVKYANGTFQMPMPLEATSPIPLTQGRTASSYDVIEGAVARSPRTQAQLRSKPERTVAERMVATDSNFYCSQDDTLQEFNKSTARVNGANQDTEGRNRRTKSNFPLIMKQIME